MTREVREMEKKVMVLFGKESLIEKECRIKYLKENKQVELRVSGYKIVFDPRVLTEAILDVLMQ